MALTKEMQRELAMLARAANRRIERASEGQRKALEYYLRNYHTRERNTGMRVFQQGAAKTEDEYETRMKELKKFMGTEDRPTISRRKRWEELKRQNVQDAGETIRKSAKYDLTDEELTTILEETDAEHGTTEFYRALENVQIAKNEAGSEWQPSKEAITEAVNARRDDQERTEALIRSRKIKSLVREARSKRRS